MSKAVLYVAPKNPKNRKASGVLVLADVVEFQRIVKFKVLEQPFLFRWGKIFEFRKDFTISFVNALWRRFSVFTAEHYVVKRYSENI